MNTDPRKCPECGGQLIFTAVVNSGGGHGAVLLPGLGSFLRVPKFKAVVCGDCGLTRFYAESRALEKLRQARQWKRV